MSFMYNKLYDLLIEGLSGASRAYRPAYRKWASSNEKLTRYFDEPDHEDWKAKTLITKNNKNQDKKDKLFDTVPKNPTRENYRKSRRYLDVLTRRMNKQGKKELD